MGQLAKVWIFLLLVCFLFASISQAYNFRWMERIGISGVYGNAASGVGVFRRAVDAKTGVDEAKCPQLCEEKLQEAFSSLGQDEMPEDMKVDSPGNPATTDLTNTDATDNVWCSGKTYLASLHVCLNQHCTPPYVEKGWEDAGKACTGGIPTADVIQEDLMFRVMQIEKINVPQGTEVSWSWTRLWAGLVRTNESHKKENDFNMILGWCIYGLAGSVLLLAAIHHGIQRYRAKNIDFKDPGYRESQSTVSYKTRATVALSKGTHLWTWIRKHFILPALFGGRHLEPIGWITLPTRIQVLAVTGFIAVNAAFLVIDNRMRPVVERVTQPGDMTRYLGDRSGFLALVNLPIIFLLGGRNNFLIGLTGLSYGVFNVFHKWVARVATALAIIHSILYMVYLYQVGGARLHSQQKNNVFWFNGSAATIVMSMIIVLAILPIRRRVYELFLILHIVGGILFLYFTFRHLQLSKHGAYNPWLWACIACWSFDRLARLWRIINCNTRKGRLVKHNAKIKVIKETNIMKISIYPNKDGVGFFPGAHYFLYFGASWKFWQSHPFTAVDWRPKKALVNVNVKARHVKKQARDRRLATATSMNDPARIGAAGVERLGTSASNGIGAYTAPIPNPFLPPGARVEDSDDNSEHGAVVDYDGAGPNAEWAAGRAKITFLVRPHKGITQTVWNRIADLSGKDLGRDKFGNRIIDPADVRGLSLSIPCLIEGPYGHQHNLHTYDTVVVIAGGIGVSTTLAYLYNHMARVEKDQTLTRRFVFIWSCREDMLMDRLIWDADLMNKTQDTSYLYSTEIEMMLYFTGTATKKPEVKFAEQKIMEISEESRGSRRDRDGDGKRPSTGKSTGRPSTGRQESSSGHHTVSNPPPAYFPDQRPSGPKRSGSHKRPAERSEKPHRSNSNRHRGEKGEKGEKEEKGERGERGEKGERGERRERGERAERGDRTEPKRSGSKRTAPESSEQVQGSSRKRSGSKRTRHETSDREQPEGATRRKESSKSKRPAAEDVDPPALQFPLDSEESRPQLIRRDTTRSNREKRRQEREQNYIPPQTDIPMQQFTASAPPPAKPIRRPSGKSGSPEKRKEESDGDRERANHSTRPPLPLKIGRPNIMEIIQNENSMLTGKMAVLVCGPDKMVDGTREAVVQCVGKDAVEGARIQYFEEAFGW